MLIKQISQKTSEVLRIGSDLTYGQAAQGLEAVCQFLLGKRGASFFIKKSLGKFSFFSRCGCFYVRNGQFLCAIPLQALYQF